MTQTINVRLTPELQKRVEFTARAMVALLRIATLGLGSKLPWEQMVRGIVSETERQTGIAVNCSLLPPLLQKFRARWFFIWDPVGVAELLQQAAEGRLPHQDTMAAVWRRVGELFVP